MSRLRSLMSAVLLPLAASLGACGGGGGGDSLAPGPSNTYDIAAGVSWLVAHGMQANLAVSGSVTVNGVAMPLTGTGTLALAVGAADTFNSVNVVTQVQTLNATVVSGGQAVTVSSAVSDHYDPATFAFLGETSSSEYDVAQSPIAFPTMVTPGSSGTLGTLSRYTDNNQGVSLGTAQISYVVKAPISASAPAVVELTNAVYDTHGALVETEVRDYSLTTANVMLLESSTVQQGTDTLTVTVQ
jgi:hypothetical protein